MDEIVSREIFDSDGRTGTTLILPDDSRVEMRDRTELSFERAPDGLRILLKKGSIFVNAAKQRTGHLYVQTNDITVSVVGTVFLVRAEPPGSRVAVIEGEVRVQEGATTERLSAGEQVATSSLLSARPMSKSREPDLKSFLATTYDSAANLAQWNRPEIERS